MAPAEARGNRHDPGNAIYGVRDKLGGQGGEGGLKSPEPRSVA